MRWPFGPPHLTLEPSKKKHKKKLRNPPPPPKKNEKNEQKTQKYQKQSFSVISQFFPFFWWVSKNSFFWHLGPKNVHPKNTIKIGLSASFLFEKQMCVTKRPFLDKKTQIQKFQLSFSFCLFLLFEQQKHKNLLKPLFYSVLANLKKDNFQKMNLKQRNLKNPILHPFF